MIVVPESQIRLVPSQGGVTGIVHPTKTSSIVLSKEGIKLEIPPATQAKSFQMRLKAAAPQALPSRQGTAILRGFQVEPFDVDGEPISSMRPSSGVRVAVVLTAAELQRLGEVEGAINAVFHGQLVLERYFPGPNGGTWGELHTSFNLGSEGFTLVGTIYHFSTFALVWKSGQPEAAIPSVDTAATTSTQSVESVSMPVSQPPPVAGPVTVAAPAPAATAAAAPAKAVTSTQAPAVAGTVSPEASQATTPTPPASSPVTAAPGSPPAVSTPPLSSDAAGAVKTERSAAESHSKVGGHVETGKSVESASAATSGQSSKNEWGRIWQIALAGTIFGVSAVLGSLILFVGRMDAYCFKCRAKRQVRSPRKITFKNGRPATRGTCGVCGTKVVTIG